MQTAGRRGEQEFTFLDTYLMSRILHIVSNVSPAFTLSFLGTVLGFDDFDNPGESWSAPLQNGSKGFSPGWTVAESHTPHQNKAAYLFRRLITVPVSLELWAESVCRFPTAPFLLHSFEGRQHMQHAGDTLSPLEHTVSISIIWN